MDSRDRLRGSMKARDGPSSRSGDGGGLAAGRSGDASGGQWA